MVGYFAPLQARFLAEQGLTEDRDLITEVRQAQLKESKKIFGLGVDKDSVLDILDRLSAEHINN